MQQTPQCVVRVIGIWWGLLLPTQTGSMCVLFKGNSSCWQGWACLKHTQTNTPADELSGQLRNSRKGASCCVCQLRWSARCSHAQPHRPQAVRVWSRLLCSRHAFGGWITRIVERRGSGPQSRGTATNCWGAANILTPIHPFAPLSYTQRVCRHTQDAVLLIN